MIYLGADHRGFKLKAEIKLWLEKWGFKFEDFGAFTFDPEDDYPDFIRLVATAVAGDPEINRGIILGGSGQGEAMVANRFKGVRAAVFYGGEIEIIRLSREHNNANILSLGANFIEEETARVAIWLWLQTPFSQEERHTRRIEKIDL
ncbi:MAG: ribose-5-phosphate isomerase [Candidatus Yanofskybacteria bacterium CG10_big_fil_rev_8_21_14_0_10_46_23]|uniref:Ribose-5-phosphate isomerase n=1 Tax=Candidatus Yanofskybacteria bacterium CG10_big_fil_rev_8_21_14_0_10_46_23 TaxID=1975098 RepID=A0A2H0R4S7_9BACT|nr:MAG: ribose-5-phosphate isomerase [Candidatus Yanofskybacteria bacterium CG10_big_fil_rev_8_21_14_0_10_46_23]